MKSTELESDKHQNQDKDEKKKTQRLNSNTQKLKFSHDKPKNRLSDQYSFDLQSFLKERDSQKMHINFNNVQKVDISSDKDYLFFGGDGLHVLYIGNTNNIGIVRYDKSKSKFNPILYLGSIILIA